MNTETPETDAQHLDFAMGGFTLDFCRQLERERDEARIQVKLLLVENNHNWQANDLAEQAFRERDALRASMREILACSLNCKDSLDEAEQMERIAKESLDIL